MADVEVTYDPITIDNGPVTVTVNGLDKTKNTITLETPKPLTFDYNLAVTKPVDTSSKFEFSTPHPLKSESKSELDVKPLAVDQCLRISLAPLPPTCIRYPTHQRIGLTVFGVEIVGLVFSGESQVMICDAAKEPFVVWGDVTAGAPSQKQPAGAAPGGQSLRIRLGG